MTQELALVVWKGVSQVWTSGYAGLCSLAKCWTSTNYFLTNLFWRALINIELCWKCRNKLFSFLEKNNKDRSFFVYNEINYLEFDPFKMNAWLFNLKLYALHNISDFYWKWMHACSFWKLEWCFWFLGSLTFDNIMLMLIN